MQNGTRRMRGRQHAILAKALTVHGCVSTAAQPVRAVVSAVRRARRIERLNVN